MRLHDIIWSGFRPRWARTIWIPSFPRIPRRCRPARCSTSSAALTDRAALEQYGINVVDVRIKRLNLPEQNKQSVYARMRAERERIARQYRAEGEEQALSIRADADRQKEEILSVAYKQAEKTKGEGDAESTRIYGQAYSRNPRFYKLLRTLESYKKVFDDKTTAILSSDSELLKVLMHGEGRRQVSMSTSPMHEPKRNWTPVEPQGRAGRGRRTGGRRVVACCGCSDAASTSCAPTSRPW